MKQLILVLAILGFGQLSAQDLQFIQKEQLELWKNGDNDTVFVLNFWATWCAPCVAELPAFEKLQEQYASQGVKVILINNDFKKQLDSKVKPFLKKRQLKSQVVYINESNPNDWIDLVSPEWSGAIPATLIVSGKKDKRLFFEKRLEYKDLEAAVLSVL